MRIRNAPAAATVATRHLIRRSEHVAPVPWSTSPAYLSAVAALRAGDLTRARDEGRRAGIPGRLLAHLVDGDLGVLGSPVGDSPSFRGRSSAGRQPDHQTVLHLVTNALPETVAGYTVRTQGIAEAQRAAGHDAHVASRLGFPVVKGHLGAGPDAEVRGVPYHRLLPALLPLRADRALAADIEHSSRLVRELRPTVLHAHSKHVNGLVGLALRERFGLPLVYEVRGLLEETWLSRSSDPTAVDTDFYRLTRSAETAVMRAADAVVTLSGPLRDHIVARGVPAERVFVVPNGVDDVWLEEPVTASRDAALTVGIGGTLNDYEGVDVLVDAVALLRSQRYDVRLVVVGDGPVRADLEKRAADRGIADVTTFTGRLPRDGVIDAYRGLDVFCLPRLDLPVTRLVPPLKPIEAMALGVPVVASDLPPLREVVAPGRGLLARPGAPRGPRQASRTSGMERSAVTISSPRASTTQPRRWPVSSVAGTAGQNQTTPVRSRPSRTSRVKRKPGP